MSEKRSEERQENIVAHKDDSTKEIIEANEERNENIKSQEIKTELKHAVTEIISEYSGPIPPPNILNGYERILPGSADRILTMAEKQSEHRQNMESKMVVSESRDSLLGVVFAFLLGMGCLGAAIIIVLNVPTNVGAILSSIFGATGIGSIIAIFLKGTRGNYHDK